MRVGWRENVGERLGGTDEGSLMVVEVNATPMVCGLLGLNLLSFMNESEMCFDRGIRTNRSRSDAVGIFVSLLSIWDSIGDCYRLTSCPNVRVKARLGLSVRTDLLPR